SGAVASATSGQPLIAARIIITEGNREWVRRSNDKGHYDLRLPPGSYSVAVAKRGYKNGATSVTILKGQTTTQDLCLQPAPSITLSGKVYDDSGHGYGLYAKLTVSANEVGVLATTWTDPATGRYKVKVPKLSGGSKYHVNIAVALSGYATVNEAFAST